MHGVYRIPKLPNWTEVPEQNKAKLAQVCRLMGIPYRKFRLPGTSIQLALPIFASAVIIYFIFFNINLYLKPFCACLSRVIRSSPYIYKRSFRRFYVSERQEETMFCCKVHPKTFSYCFTCSRIRQFCTNSTARYHPDSKIISLLLFPGQIK